MSIRTLALALAFGYFVFSIFYLVIYGLEDPRRAFWVGVVGLVVITVAMIMRRVGKK